MSIKIFNSTNQTPESEFELYIFQDIFYTDKLRADSIDSLEFNVFSSSVIDEFKLGSKTTIYRSPSDDLLIKQDNIEYFIYHAKTIKQLIILIGLGIQLKMTKGQKLLKN